MDIPTFSEWLSEADEDSLMQDLTSIGFEGYKGWIVCTESIFYKSIQTGIYAVVAKSVYDASGLILENMGVLDDKNELADPGQGDTFDECLGDQASKLMRYFRLSTYYEGLIPIKAEEYCLEIDWTNPLMAMKDLRVIFRNVDTVLNK